MHFNMFFFKGFCKAWWRLEVLIKRGLIRRRSYKKEAVLQLLPLGRDIAMRLRGKSNNNSLFSKDCMRDLDPRL